MCTPVFWATASRASAAARRFFAIAAWVSGSFAVGLKQPATVLIVRRVGPGKRASTRPRRAV